MLSFPCSYIEIDKIVSVKALPGAQQDKTNCAFHVVTESRTYELLAHDEATMNKYDILYTCMKNCTVQNFDGRKFLNWA